MHLLKYDPSAKTLTEVMPGKFAADPTCHYFYVEGKRAAVPILMHDGIGEIVWEHPSYQPPLPANQHRATDEQWATAKKWAYVASDSSCLLELRDRIQQLEAAQQVPDPYAGRPSSLTDDERKATEEAAEAWARCAVEQLRSKPATRLLFKTETTYGEASDHARRLVRNANSNPITVEGSFEMGGKSYAYKGQAEPAPCPQPPTLINRVANALYDVPLDSDAEARAAIREVAAWLRENPGPNSAWFAVARDLMDEVNQ